MNIKWGWWSFGFSVLLVLLPFLGSLLDLNSGFFVILYSVLFGSSAILALAFGIIAIIKRKTESKISLVFAILSIVIIMLLLIFALILGLMRETSF